MGSARRVESSEFKQSEAITAPRGRGWFVRDTPAIPLLLTLVVYLRCLGNQFVYDDKDMVVNNLYIGRFSMIWKSFVSDSWWFQDPHDLPQSAYYRPLQDVWLSLNYHLFGFSPVGWHATIVLLHLAVVWLVFLVARELTRRPWMPLLAAIWFGVLPVHAQAVVWPTAIPLPMSAFFELLSLLYFMRGKGFDRNRKWSLVFYVLGQLSHESPATFPVLLFGYALLFEPEPNPRLQSVSIREQVTRALSETWPYFAALGAYLAIRILVLGFITRTHIANPMSWATVFMTLPEVLSIYLKLMFAPWLDGPSHHVEVIHSLGSRLFFLPLLFLAVLGEVASVLIWKSPQRRFYLFCLLWMLLGIAPVLNLRQFPELVLVEDRYTYMSSIALCMMLAELVLAATKYFSIPFAALAVGAATVAALEAGLLFHVESYWHDEVAMFTKCTELSPGSWICHDRLGTSLLRAHDLAGAEAQFRTSLDVYPDDPMALMNLATVEKDTGRPDEAIANVERAIEVLPKFGAKSPGVFVDLAKTADMLGAVDVRERAFEQASTYPHSEQPIAIARGELAILHHDYATAESLMRRHLEQDPDDILSWALLASSLERQGRYRESLVAYQKALTLEPGPKMEDTLREKVQELSAEAQQG